MNNQNKKINQISKILHEINLSIKACGGKISYVSLDNGILVLKASGMCTGCVNFDVTLDTIYQIIMNSVPDLIDIEFKR